MKQKQRLRIVVSLLLSIVMVVSQFNVKSVGAAYSGDGGKSEGVAAVADGENVIYDKAGEVPGEVPSDVPSEVPGDHSGTSDSYELYLGGFTVSDGIWTGERNYFSIRPEIDYEDYEDYEQFDMIKLVKGAIMAAPYMEEEAQLFYFNSSQKKAHRITMGFFDSLDPDSIVVEQGGVPIEASFTKEDIGGGFLYQGNVIFEVGADEKQAKPVTISYEGESRVTLTRFLPIVKTEGMTGPAVGEMYITKVNDDGSINMEISGINLPVGESALSGQQSFWIGVENYDPETYESYAVAFYQTSGYVEAESDPDLGIYVYNMKPTGTNDTQGCWYPIYMGQNPLKFGNDEEATFPTLNPLKGKLEMPDGPKVKKPKVNVPYQVTGETVTVAFTAGDYANFRYKLNDGEFSEWSAIPESFDIKLKKNAYGYYELKFEFSDAEGGNIVSADRGFGYYNGTVAPAPSDAGVREISNKNIPLDNNTYKVYSGAAYKLYAVDEEGKKLEALLIDSYNNEEAVALSWDDSRKEYSVVLPEDKLSGISSVAFRRCMEEYDLYSAEKIIRNIDVMYAPNVNYATYPQMEKHYNYSNGAAGYVIDQDVVINYSFRGSEGDGIDGYADLIYVPIGAGENDTPETLTIPMKADNGIYTASQKLPEDASRLIEVIYYLKDELGTCGETKTYSLSQYIISSNLTLSGFSEAYEGTSVRLFRENGGAYSYYYRWGSVENGQVSFSNIGPDNYKYVINGSSGYIAEGKIKVLSGNNNIVLDGLPKLYDLKVKAEGEGADVMMASAFFSRSDNDTGNSKVWIDLSKEEFILKQFPDGAKGVITVSAWDDRLKLPEAETITFTDNIEKIIKVEPFKTRTISGTVTGNGHAIANQTVRAVQTYMHDGASKTVSCYGYTDSDGKYELPGIITEFAAELTVEASNFKKSKKEADAGSEDAVLDFDLELRDDLIIQPVLKVKPIVMTDANGQLLKDENGNEIVSGIKDVYTDGDSSLLSPAYVRKVVSEGYEPYIYIGRETLGAGSTRYYLDSYSDLKAGDKLRVFFNQLPESTGYHLEENCDGTSEYTYYKCAAEGELNSQRNLELEVKTLRLGEFRATVVETDSDMTGYLLVFDKTSDKLVAQASGKGELTASGIPEGEYTVVTVKATAGKASAVSSMIANSPNQLLKTAVNGNKQALAISATAAWGQSRYLGELAPEIAAGTEVLGDFDTHYTTDVQPDGTVNVNVSLTQADITKSFNISYITLNKTSKIDGFARYDGRDMYTGSDGKTYYGYPYASTGNLSLAFNDCADDSSKLNVKITIYYYDAEYVSKQQVIEINENVDLFNLVVPENYVVNNGETTDDWSIPVVIRNTPDGTIQTVTIYDNGKEAGTYNVSAMDTKINLVLPDRFAGTHVIYAVKGDGANSRTTVNYILSVKDGAKEIYLSHFYWLHKNDTRINQWFFKEIDEMTGKTFRYYPIKGSTIVFRLNNVSPDEIENVKFITYYNDTETYWNARLLETVDSKYMTELEKDMGNKLNSYEGNKWSTWIVDRIANPDAYGNDFGPSLSYFSTFGVDYDLKSDAYMDGSVKATLSLEQLETLLADETEAGSDALISALFDPSVTAYSDAVDKAETYIYNLAYGAETMDYNDQETLEALKNGTVSVNIDALPSALRDNIPLLSDEGNITKTDSSYKVEISDEDATKGLTGFSMEYEVENSSESALRQRMYEEQTKKAEGDPAYQNISWITFESEQGPVYVRQEILEEKKDDGDSTGDAFASKIQTEYFLPSTAVTNALDSADVAVLNSLLGENDQTAVSASMMDQSMTGLKGLGEVHGYYDVYQDIQIAKYGEESRFLSKGVGTGMNVVNTVTTAYEISKGPSGRSPEGLWNALSQLKGSTEHSRRAIQTLTASIKDYSDLRDEMYLWDSAQAAAGAGGGWANLNVPAKIAFIVGGKIYDTINKTWSYPALNSTYDTIMKDIMYEIRKEAEFEKKEEEKRLKELEEKMRKRLKKEGIKDWDLERKLKEVMKELLDNKLKLRIKVKIPKFKLYIDPSGYVFEGVDEDRVAGITASLYQGNGAKVEDTTSYILWSDPGTEDDLPQQNPLTTADAGDTVTDAEGNKISGEDAKGRYGWMTPEGVWMVRFSDPSGKYKDAETKPMEVPPAHTTVNIGLLSNAVPSVKIQDKADGVAGAVYSEDAGLSLTENKLSFSFDTWMQLESLIDVTQSGAENSDGSYRSEFAAFEVTDQDGNVVPGVIYFPDRTANTGYKESLVVDKYNDKGEKTGTETVYNKYQTDFIDSDWFVKSVVFCPSDDFAAGKEYKLTIRKSVMSYSGVAMAADYSASVKVPLNTVEFGDVNGDKSIDAKDVTALRRFLAGGWNVTINEANSDVNNDGTVNSKDVTQLRRYLAGGWGVELGKTS